MSTIRGWIYYLVLAITLIPLAVVLIVSEETQAVSLAFESEFFYDLKRDELSSYLSGIFEFESAIRELPESAEPSGGSDEK